MFRSNGNILTFAHCSHTFYPNGLTKISRIQVQGQEMAKYCLSPVDRDIYFGNIAHKYCATQIRNNYNNKRLRLFIIQTIYWHVRCPILHTQIELFYAAAHFQRVCICDMQLIQCFLHSLILALASSKYHFFYILNYSEITVLFLKIKTEQVFSSFEIIYSSHIQ